MIGCSAVAGDRWRFGQQRDAVDDPFSLRTLGEWEAAQKTAMFPTGCELESGWGRRFLLEPRRWTRCMVADGLLVVHLELLRKVPAR